MNAILASLIALAAVAAGAFPATAGPAAADRLRLAQHVSYADLDLAREADARRLVNRLRRAAAELCESGDISVARQTQSRACRHAALSSAVSELAAPRVAAAFDGRPVG